jgi:hypothetical protein
MEEPFVELAKPKPTGKPTKFVSLADVMERIESEMLSFLPDDLEALARHLGVLESDEAVE